MMKIEIEVTRAGWKQGYNKRTEVFDEQRLSYIESIAPTPWKCKTNYSNYTVFDAEGKRIATLPNGEKDNQVDGVLIRDLLTVAPELLAEVMRLRQAFLIAASCGEDGWGHLQLWQTLEDAGIDCDALPSGQWSEESSVMFE